MNRLLTNSPGQGTGIKPLCWYANFSHGENSDMKTSRNTTNKQSKQGLSKKPRPEIRDDMDSRERKEAGYRKPAKKPAKKKSR